MFAGTGVEAIGFEIGDKESFLRRREPSRVGRLVDDDDERQQSDDDRGEAFQDEEPLPVGEPHTAAHRAHHPARDRAAEDG